MTCREFVEFLMAYLEGELDGEALEIFERHLCSCAGCVSYMKSYKQTVEMGRCVCKEENGPVPEDAPRELVEAILAARKAQ